MSPAQVAHHVNPRLETQVRKLTFLHLVAQHVDLRLAGARAPVQVQTADLQLRGGCGLCKRRRNERKKKKVNYIRRRQQRGGQRGIPGSARGDVSLLS